MLRRPPSPIFRVATSNWEEKHHDNIQSEHGTSNVSEVLDMMMGGW